MTAAGIDNNGELVFPYGKEDTDYRVAGVTSSGYVFNGAGSIIWRRISQSFTDEIADIFNRVNEAACFDATSLINEFDTFQNCFPEEMWRLDIERKYVRTFTGKVYDNCKLTDADGNTKQNPRFLKEMMQGRKKYQRRQWVRDQAIYFGSKYMLNNVRSNTIEMVCYTPDFQLWSANSSYNVGDYVLYKANAQDSGTVYYCTTANNDSVFIISKWVEGVTPNYQLKITPYQDMYINVAVGNGNLRTPKRAVAGQEYTIDCTANMNETRIYIYAGSYIQALSNLAPFYIGANIFSSAARLKKLDLGTDNTTYHNTNLKSLTVLPNMPILEELNIKNCDNLNTPINLSGSNNLKIVEAEGSIIPSLSLPAYTKIETLHLPSTINMLNLSSARNLTEFYMKNKTTGLEDYSNLINVNITDSDYSTNVNWMEIAAQALPHVNSLYLQDLNKSSIDTISDLEQFAVRKAQLETSYDDYGNLINKLNLSGNITVVGQWSEIEKISYENTWPNLELIVDQNNKVVKHNVTYVYEVNGVEKTYSMYVDNQATFVDIYYTHLIDEMPTKAQTIQTSYSFGIQNNNVYIRNTGWKIQGEAQTIYEYQQQYGQLPRITSDITVIPVFTETPRRYSINWYLKQGDSTPVYTAGPFDYNGGDSAEAPTVDYIRDTKGLSTCTIQIDRNRNPIMVHYEIFNGWNKLPIKISPENINDTYINIYGKWLTGDESVPAILENLDNISPLQLAVLSKLNSQERASYLDTGKQITFNVGYTGPDDDVDNSGELIIGKGSQHTVIDTNNDTHIYEIARLLPMTNTDPFRTTIQPLKEGQDEFTLAVDYSFDKTQIESQGDNTELQLMGCYERNNGSVAGFKLYYYKGAQGSGPRLSFGDTTETNGHVDHAVPLGISETAHYRNTIVLRHPKGSRFLYVYSGINGNPADNGVKSGSIITNLNDSTLVSVLEYSNFNTNAYLTFGNATLDTSSFFTPANGTIYWAKYWNKDLGLGECKKLAAWNHESMTYGVEYLNDGITSNFVFPQASGDAGPKLVLTSLTGSKYGHLMLEAQRNDGAYICWENSALQSIANKRIFYSLPIQMQSIITKSPVQSRKATYSSSQFSSSFDINPTPETIVRTSDYIFFPSSVEFGNNDSSGVYKPAEASNVMPWYSAQNTRVYTYNSGQQIWVSASTGDANYMNLRFPIAPIKTETGMNTIYKDYTSTTNSIYQAIGAESIRRGDIFIHNTLGAFIYVTSEDIANGAEVVLATTVSNSFFYCNGNGGWVAADNYWTRSPYNNNGTTGTFMYVDNTGVLQMNAKKDSNDGHGFIYSFSI